MSLNSTDDRKSSTMRTLGQGTVTPAAIAATGGGGSVEGGISFVASGETIRPKSLLAASHVWQAENVKSTERHRIKRRVMGPRIRQERLRDNPVSVYTRRA